VVAAAATTPRRVRAGRKAPDSGHESPTPARRFARGTAAAAAAAGRARSGARASDARGARAGRAPAAPFVLSAIARVADATRRGREAAGPRGTTRAHVDVAKSAPLLDMLYLFLYPPRATTWSRTLSRAVASRVSRRTACVALIDAACAVASPTRAVNRPVTKAPLFEWNRVVKSKPKTSARRQSKEG
jgi:hypothetical protein